MQDTSIHRSVKILTSVCACVDECRSTSLNVLSLYTTVHILTRTYELYVFMYTHTHTQTHTHTHTHARAHTTRRRRNLDPQAQLAAGVWEEPYLRKQRDDRQHVPSRVGCLPRKVRGLRMGEFQKMCDPMMLKNQKPAMDPNSKKLSCGFWVALVEDFGFAA